MSPLRAARLLLSALLLTSSLAAPAPTRAQEAGEPLFLPEDALWAGGFLLGAAAMAPLDIHVARRIQDSIPQSNRVYRVGERALYYLGFPGGLAVGGGLYAAGKLVDEPGVAEVGLRTTEAIVVATLATGVAKVLIGRARPAASPDHPFDVAFGRGFRSDEFQSFPSGHTSAAFAAAAAITTEVGHRAPELKAATGVALYGTAALVGVSRLYRNAHWASDVVIGAAVGSFAGWKIVHYHRTHPNTRIDRALLDRPPPGPPGPPLLLVWRVPF